MARSERKNKSKSKNRAFITIYYFNSCPFTTWSRDKNLKLHFWLVRESYKLSRAFPFLEFGDFYNAGVIGYLRFLLKTPITIDNDQYVLAYEWVKQEMHRLIDLIYGRLDCPHSRCRREAIHLSYEENGENDDSTS